VNDIVARVDVDALVDRIDVDRIVERVDLDALMARVDIDQILEKTEFSSIIAKSTSGALSQFLGLLRRQVVSLDVIFDRLTGRGHRFADRPPGPPKLETQWRDEDDGRQGEYAGAISRLLAIVADGFAAWCMFLLGVGATQASLSLFMTKSPQLFHHSVVTVCCAVVWYFVYFTWQWSLGGRTLGMAAVGIRVTTSAGAVINQRNAVKRILVLPFSILILALGLVGIVLRPDRRGWHDRVADTCVVYDWDARTARLHWLNAA
jgi:uncharacterized RDD family membrane protein YckC